MLTGWRPDVVDWGGGVCCSCSICAPAPLALANQLPLPAIVQRGCLRHCRVSSAIEESDLYLLALTVKCPLTRCIHARVIEGMDCWLLKLRQYLNTKKWTLYITIISIRPMSHLQFYRAILSRNFIARQSHAIKLQVRHPFQGRRRLNGRHGKCRTTFWLVRHTMHFARTTFQT